MSTRIIQHFHQRLQHELSCFVWSVKCQTANCTTCFSSSGTAPADTAWCLAGTWGTRERVASTNMSEREQKGQTRNAREGKPQVLRWGGEGIQTHHTMQGGQASLVLLLTKDLVKCKKSKTDSVCFFNLKKHCKMLIWCFLKGSLFSYNFCRICSHIYNINEADFLLGKKVWIGGSRRKVREIAAATPPHHLAFKKNQLINWLKNTLLSHWKWRTARTLQS